MSDFLGSVAIVLHGHLPYVLRHGVWPHGEDWLYEAAAETYLPLLSTIDECVFFNGQPKLVMGLTPVLLEQLSHDDFKKGFIAYCEDRIERAKEDEQEFKSFDNGHMAYLAQRWQEFFTKLIEQFEGYGRDIPKAYAERAAKGYCEILTSNATHAYMPLLYEDASIRAQIRAGVYTSERILGFKPTGMWLPECAYRPGGAWNPPIGWAGKGYRIGIEHLVADEGVDHFFLEDKLITSSRSEQVFNDGKWWKVDWSEGEKYPSRGWKSVNEAHGVNSDGTGLARAYAFGRDQEVCERVWSGAIGYPADGAYLEFHKKWGARRGLRYWKITGNKVDLGDKHLYYPENIPGKLHEHAQHFVNTIKDRLRSYRDRVGRPGIVVTSFDAELFGHWWFEGPQFLRDVMLSVNADPQVNMVTTREYLDSTFVDKVVSLPEGSWGEGGDHRVWTNEQVNWMWEIEYRCEATFGRLTSELPWRDPKRKEVRELLEKAGRELLLLQASDWPFVIRRGQAVDYGTKRFVQHVARFETMADHAENAAQKGEGYLKTLTEVQKHEMKDAEIHDVIFPHIDLNWWNM